MERKTIVIRNSFDIKQIVKISLITPEDALRLRESGIDLQIESSTDRIFSDQEFIEKGIPIVEQYEWKIFSLNTIIIGLLPPHEDESMLTHTHLCFYQQRNTEETNKILSRIDLGKGKILELNDLLQIKYQEIEELLNNKDTDLKEISKKISNEISNLFLLEVNPKWLTAEKFFIATMQKFKTTQNTNWSKMSVAKREQVRVKFETFVTFGTETVEPIRCKSKNISLSGIFVITDKKPFIAEECTLTIEFNGNENSKTKKENTKSIMIIKGQIARVIKDGVGISFNDMDLNTFDKIKEIIKLNANKLEEYY